MVVNKTGTEYNLNRPIGGAVIEERGRRGSHFQNSHLLGGQVLLMNGKKWTAKKTPPQNEEKL